MAVRNDLDQQNDCSTEGDWTTGGANAPDAPKLNNSSSTVPYYIEGTSCMDFPMKSNADGYTYDGVANVDFENKVFVFWYWIPGPDVAGLPLTTFRIRFSDAAGFTTDYDEWDMLPQLEALPGSFVPLKVWATNATDSDGTPDNSAVSSYGLVVATGGTDNKAAAFDHAFLISEIGGHSETWTNTFFDDLMDDATSGSLADVIGIFTRAGAFFQSSINIAIGNDVAANTSVTETGKVLFFDNIEPEHDLGYIFYGGSTGEINLYLTDCVHFWTSQESTAEIFTQITEVDDFELVGCSFSNGGAWTLPADAADRFVRGTKFDACQAGTISDGEFTGCIVSNGEAVTVSGDADLTGTQILTPVVAANASGLLWNGNFDPDGNLDNMAFSQAAVLHHAIEFGTASPLTMTLRGIDFTGFSASTDVNNSTFHIKRTTGTVTINLIGCTGVFGYRTDGAAVDLVVSPVTTTITVLDGRDNSPLLNARVILEASDNAGDLDCAATVTITRSGAVATVTHTAHPYVTGNKVVIRGTTAPEYRGPKTITVTGVNTYTFAVSGTPTTPAVPFGRVANGEDETAYDNTPSTQGTFSGGTGHAVSDIIRIRKGIFITVDAVSGGVVTQFTVDSCGAQGQILAGDVLAQTNTDGAGAGFTLTPDTDNIVIQSTGAVLEGLTNASGEISDTRSWALAQPIRGRAALSTTSPRFKAAPLVGTISITAGLSAAVALVLDE